MRVAVPKRWVVGLALSLPLSACELLIDIPSEPKDELEAGVALPPANGGSGAAGTTAGTGPRAGHAGTADASGSDHDAAPSGLDAGMMQGGSSGSDDAGDTFDAGEPECAELAIRLYRDRDGDGHGDLATSRELCPPTPAGWVDSADDCQDDDPDVHPGQLGYFGAGYHPATDPGSLSFDYDCDGMESGAPEQSEAPDCAGLAVAGLGCEGEGYEPINPPRDGPGINPLCGSNVVSACAPAGLLECAPVTRTIEPKYLCR